MAIEPYETSELLTVVENFPPINNYWLSLGFSRVATFQSEWIDLDLVDRENRLAPFVAPNNQGQPMVAQRRYSRRVKAAYLKPKDPIDPARLLVRQAGEAWGGSLTLQEREDAIVADTFAEHDRMIRRRWEWMACEAIKFGQVTMVGENYPESTVVFGRSSSHTVALTSTARWNQPTTATPLDDIQNWVTLMYASGRPARRLTMGSNASKSFFATDQVKAELDLRRGSSWNPEVRIIDGQAAVFHGRLPGSNIEIWTYHDTYVDNDGAAKDFLDPNAIVLTGDPEGVQCFGAILDAKAGYQSLPIFPKMWYSEDPSGLFCMTQSAPLMVPTRPNSTFYATVQ